MTTLTFDVTERETAAAVGSGDVPVLATPALLAWCEATTVAALLPQGVGVGQPQTSVGTRVELEHRLATPVGGQIRVVATLDKADGRLRTFSVVALDRHDQVVATGSVRRVVVDRDRFVSRLPEA